jgi:hypothetical protein
VTSSGSSSVFACFRFPPEVISVAIRWYQRYGLFSGTSKNCWRSASSPLIISAGLGVHRHQQHCASTPTSCASTPPASGMSSPRLWTLVLANPLASRVGRDDQASVCAGQAAPLSRTGFGGVPQSCGYLLDRVEMAGRDIDDKVVGLVVGERQPAPVDAVESDDRGQGEPLVAID